MVYKIQLKTPSPAVKGFAPNAKVITPMAPVTAANDKAWTGLKYNKDTMLNVITRILNSVFEKVKYCLYTRTSFVKSDNIPGTFKNKIKIDFCCSIRIDMLSHTSRNKSVQEVQNIWFPY